MKCSISKKSMTNIFYSDEPFSYMMEKDEKIDIMCNLINNAYINKINIITEKLNEAAPTEWIIYGKNDNMKNYVILNDVKDKIYNSLSLTINLKNITTYYNNIIFSITKTAKNDGFINLKSFNFLISIWEDCVPEDNWPETHRGEEADTLCQNGYIGRRQRNCSDEISPVWSKEINDKECSII